MRSLRIAGIALLAALAVGAEPPSAAFDLTGTWMGMVPGKGRRLDSDIAFQFVQHGAELSGKLYVDKQPGAAILEGRVSELGDIHFLVETRDQSGNQINDVRYRFEGVMCDGGIEMTLERVFQRDAISGDITPVSRPDDTPAQDRDRRFRSFRLEKLY
ncbi:MAG: hypothetical protein GC160_22775 [Acidobacteria bacterium]|nr:hypothetical protein [Acidobacteriota bacterium]